MNKNLEKDGGMPINVKGSSTVGPCLLMLCVSYWSSMDMYQMAPLYNSPALTLLHSERPKLYTILAFLSAIGLMVNQLN